MLLDQSGESDFLGDDGEEIEEEREGENEEMCEETRLQEKREGKEEDNSSTSSLKGTKEIEVPQIDFQRNANVDNSAVISKRKKFALRLDKIPITIEPYLAKAKINFSSPVPNEVSAKEGKIRKDEKKRNE